MGVPRASGVFAPLTCCKFVPSSLNDASLCRNGDTSGLFVCREALIDLAEPWVTFESEENEAAAGCYLDGFA